MEARRVVRPGAQHIRRRSALSTLLRASISASIGGSVGGLLAGCGGGDEGGEDGEGGMAGRAGPASVGSGSTPEELSGAACKRSGRVLSCWGDSTHAGAYAAEPRSELKRYLSPRPTERIVQRLGCAASALDRSVSGSLTQQYVVGWRQAVEADPASLQVLRFGGADAVVGTPPEQFRDALERLVSISRGAGKRVVLVGLIHVARGKSEWGWSDDMLRALDERANVANAVVRELAALHRLALVDLRRAVRFDGAADIADAVHPAQEYSDRCADAIARTTAALFDGIA